MASFYVFDKVLISSESASSDPTDRLTGTSDNYMVSSAKLSLKRNLTVFDQYEPAQAYFDRLSNPLKNYMHRLWHVSAWTRRGAAKKCMKLHGSVIKLAAKDENPQDHVVGELMLRAMETTNLSAAELNELHGDLKSVIKD